MLDFPLIRVASYARMEVAAVVGSCEFGWTVIAEGMSMSRGHHLFVDTTFAILTTVCVTPVLASKVTFSSLPSVNSSVLVADDTTQYTVTLTASSIAGSNDIRSLRVLFNITESGGDTTRGRGYMAWGTTDADITNFGGTWVFADATGGGRWAYRTDAWGGTTYITPLSCTISTGGNATGGTGTRTATFTFTVKPAWANNPLINDADAWAMTANDGPNESDYCMVGWKDGPDDLAVVAAPCTQTAATPSAPIVSNPTENTLDVAVSPADSDTDVFAIRISPPGDDPTNVNMTRGYVQGDGSLGGQPFWQTKAAWSTTTVIGLASSKLYTFRLCAFDGDAGTCPSPWGLSAEGTTALQVHAIDCAAAGTIIHKGVHGMDAQAKMFNAAAAANTLAVSYNTSMRNGGDGYNWKTRTAQWNSSTVSTLQYLRHARDRNSYLQIVTNTRGIGTGNGSTWVYTDQTPETLAALTADMVYYCNVLVQTKRQGDPLTPREQALLDSLDWGTDDKLLAPGEEMVPKVVWWEIGNEPEGPYPPPAMTPEDYANRYRIISAAMLAEDPTIKIGPGCMTANNGNAWLDAVFANPVNRVDLVVYHPYGNLYGITRNNTGGNLDASYIMRGLDVQKKAQIDAKQKIVDRLVAHNRPADTPLILSEWNTSSWQGTYYYELGQTVAQGLGTVEDIFSFIEIGIIAAQYWDQPNIPNRDGLEVPCFKVFKALQSYLPDRLIDSLVDGYFRLYTTRDSGYDRLILWAVNLSETDDTPVRVQLQNLPAPLTVASVTRKTLAAYTGETSLITRSKTTEVAGWTETDLTGQIDPADFTLTFDNATLSMLIFDLNGNGAPMVLAPTGLTRTSSVGEPLSDDTFTVASGGPDTLDFAIEASAPWLSAAPATGSSGNTPVPIAVHYDIAGLAPGEHTATITVSSEDSYNSPQTINVRITIETVVVDYDRDGDVDIADFGHFQACYSGAATPQNDPNCQDAKLDEDGNVDEHDFAIFLGCLTGPGLPPDPNCLN